jgi:Family of unknown function (DUF6459)
MSTGVRRWVDSKRVRPAIRLRPAPPLEPPFDDELSPQAWVVAPTPGQLALDWTVAASVPRQPGPADQPAETSGVVAGASPESRQAARRFAATCLEILNGYRPTGQVRPLVSPPEATDISEQLELGRQRVAELRQHTAPRVGLRRSGRDGAPAGLITLGPVRVCEPRPGIAEVAAVLASAGRSWAFAFRLERRRDAWLCTAARML